MLFLKSALFALSDRPASSFTHCAKNHIFLYQMFLKKWSFQKNCTGIWSSFYYQKRWYLFFQKIWYFILHFLFFIFLWYFFFGQKMRDMIFVKKYMEMWYFMYKGFKFDFFFSLFSWRYSAMTNRQYSVAFCPQELHLEVCLSIN